MNKEDGMKDFQYCSFMKFFYEICLKIGCSNSAIDWIKLFFFFKEFSIKRKDSVKSI